MSIHNFTILILELSQIIGCIFLIIVILSIIIISPLMVIIECISDDRNKKEINIPIANIV